MPTVRSPPSTDVCGGSLTGGEELMLELSCVDMEELGPGAAPEPGSYERDRLPRETRVLIRR
jgi:hypothetical protein